MGSHDFFNTFSMALYHVENGFTYVLQFFSLIFDGLGGVIEKETDKSIYYNFMRFGDSSTVHNPLKQ